MNQLGLPSCDLHWRRRAQTEVRSYQQQRASEYGQQVETNEMY